MGFILLGKWDRRRGREGPVFSHFCLANGAGERRRDRIWFGKWGSEGREEGLYLVRQMGQEKRRRGCIWLGKKGKGKKSRGCIWLSKRGRIGGGDVFG